MALKATPWRPILADDLAGKAERTVVDMAHAMSSIETNDPSLRGQCGLGVFYGYLSRAFPGSGFAEMARSRLEIAVNLVGSRQTTPWLFNGFSGLGWTLEHLRHLASDFVGDADSNDEIDEAVEALLALSPWPASYDLISGLVGLGVYARERDHRPAIASVVERLSELARPVADGVTWWTDPRVLSPAAAAQFPEGYHCLGMAHGVAGILAFLASVCAHDAVAETARLLLDRGVCWLLQQRLCVAASSSFARTTEESLPTRPVWCHGDLGIALALLAAGRATEKRSLEQAAIEVALRAIPLARDDRTIVDGCLCHGASGLAHIFNRFYQATQLEPFLDAARYWLTQVIDHWYADSALNADLLLGAPGMGLALLASISDLEPGWDRILLCSSSSNA